MMTPVEQRTRIVTQQTNFEQPHLQQGSSEAIMFAYWEDQRRSLEKDLASLREPGGSLRELLLSSESSRLQVVSLFRCYSVCHDLFLAPAGDAKANIADLLIEMDCLGETIHFLKGRHATNEQQRFTNLYNLGRLKLLEESEKLIEKYDHPVPPHELLSLCRSTNPTTVETDTDEVSDLVAFRLIFDWFKELGFRQGLIDSYSKKKGMTIQSSLQSLLEHLRHTSVRRPSINIVNASRCSPGHRIFTTPEVLREKVQTKVSGIGRRLRRSSVMGGAESSMASNHLLLPSRLEDQRFLSVGHLPMPGAPSDNIETNHYKFLLDALLALLHTELDLLFYAFSNEFKSLVFTNLIAIPLECMQREAHKLCETVRQLPNKISTGKPYLHGILSILDWFLRSKRKFTKIYHDSNLPCDYPFASNLSAIFEQSVMACLRSVLEEVEKDSSARTPGGAVHQLTSDLLSFMGDLMNFEHIIDAIDHGKKFRTRSFGSEWHNTCHFDLSAYLAHLIRSIRANLQKKAETYIPSDDQNIGTVFLLNNTKCILEHLEHSPLLSILRRTDPDLRIKLTNQLNQYISEYTKCCTPMVTAMQQIYNYDGKAGAASMKLSERDRQQIKESFLTVNTLIGTLRQHGSQHVIDDGQLRDQLRNEIKETILQPYTDHHNRFSQTKFTRNTEKYLRYSPVMLQSIIEHLFEH